MLDHSGSVITDPLVLRSPSKDASVPNNPRYLTFNFNSCLCKILIACLFLITIMGVILCRINPPGFGEVKRKLMNAADELFINEGNVHQTTLHLRLYRDLLKVEKPAPKTLLAINFLNAQLFHWIRDINDLKSRAKKPRGIVLTTGKKLFPLMVHCIKTIRWWGSNLPIEVHLNGFQELDEDMIKYLKTLPDVTVVNLRDFFDDTYLKMSGWDAKPFAMLASSFKEVILLDADAVLMQSPNKFYEYEEYKSTGTLFFKDRIMVINRGNALWYNRWFRSMFPSPLSASLKGSNMFNGKTNYEQESGLVIIDKERHWIGLLAICLLNAPLGKSEIRKYTHGDKETFWLGMEMAEEPYSFLSDSPGHFGHATKEKGIWKIGGHLAHFDRQGNFLWFNDSILDSKKDLKGKLLNYKDYMWKGHWPNMVMQGEEVSRLSVEQEKALEEIKKLWQTDPLKPH